MDKRRRRSVPLQYALIVVLLTAIVVILFTVINRAGLNVTAHFDPDPTAFRNPLTGFAPDARNTDQCAESGLVFILLRWADWEPSQGVYEMDTLESLFHTAEWKREKKHAILRFVCDIPGKEDHLDIPGWLYEQTSDGTHYDTGLGKGYSPDYANPRFQEAHRQAVRKLAEYCNRDSFITYVEIGSIGHWGEWHAEDGTGRSLLPDSEICESYIRLYADSFDNALILMRRNYKAAVEENMGFYNDMIGDIPSTEEWLNWLQKGGEQRTSGTALSLVPAKNLGKNAPVGGEFTSGIPMETMLGENFGDVLASISASGMTFIGPQVPDLTDEDTRTARESILRRTGYRIYVSTLQMKYDFSRDSLDVLLTWKNAGNAGFFYDWPVTLYVFDSDRRPVYWETLNLDLRDLNREDEIITETRVPFSDRIKDGFYLGVEITDYNGQEHVSLAISDEQMEESFGGMQILYHYQ